MAAAEIEKRRRKLTRTYELTAMLREVGLGHKSTGVVRKLFARIRILVETQFLSHYFGRPPKWRMVVRRFGDKRTLPDFCVIGPYKSGTSDMAVNLCLHPAVMAPLTKEITQPDPQKWRTYYPTPAQKEAHAKNYGAAVSPYLAPYLHSVERAYLISRNMPEAKIVLILRDPAARVYSHWKWEYFLAGQRRAAEYPFLKTFEAYVDSALGLFPENTMFTACGTQPLHTSIYVHAVEYWLERFPREQVLVLNMAEYWKSRSAALNRIYDFIGLERFDVPLTDVKTNSNPLTHLPPADEASMQKLREFFRPYNERLFDVIGARFEW